MEIIKRLEAHRQSQPHQKRVRYPTELKRVAGVYYQRQLDLGRTRYEVAQELGVHANTLDCWRVKKTEKAPVAAFRSVVVSADKRVTAAAVVVHGPSGLRIEGLGVAQLIELVRALR